MILLTVIQLVPTISQADLLLVISRLFPEKVYPLVESIVTDLYTTARSLSSL